MNHKKIYFDEKRYFFVPEGYTEEQIEELINDFKSGKRDKSRLYKSY